MIFARKYSRESLAAGFALLKHVKQKKFIHTTTLLRVKFDEKLKSITKKNSVMKVSMIQTKTIRAHLMKLSI